MGFPVGESACVYITPGDSLYQRKLDMLQAPPK